MSNDFEKDHQVYRKYWCKKRFYISEKCNPIDIAYDKCMKSFKKFIKGKSGKKVWLKANNSYFM